VLKKKCLKIHFLNNVSFFPASRAADVATAPGELLFGALKKLATNVTNDLENFSYFCRFFVSPNFRTYRIKL
jgi:hypothetical protein